MHEAVFAKAAEMKENKGEIKNPFVSLGELREACSGDETLSELLDEMLGYCLRYAETVCQFEQVVMAGGDRAEIDAIRGTVHDATMDAINILSRNLQKRGKDNQWIAKIVNDRAKYGKMAILLAFEKILSEPQTAGV